MSSCSLHDCTLEVFENKDKCILHCEKDDWYDIHDNVKIWNNKKVNDFWQIIQDDLSSIKEISQENSSILLEKLVYNQVIFPKFEEECTYNIYEDNRMDMGTNFYSFMYETNSLNSIFNELDIRFYQCKFLEVADFKKYIFKKKLKFVLCRFFSELELPNNITGELTIDNCYFTRDLFLKGINFSKRTEIIAPKNVNSILIVNCNFEDDFLLYLEKLNFLDISSTTFKNNVWVLGNCSELEVLDFHNSSFYNLLTLKNIKVINPVTLDNIKLFNKTRFFNLAFSVKNRETARIIKDSFEQQNNIIEANRFYALEMEKYDSEITWKDNFKDKLIFKLHDWSSQHSQNWLLALFWILILSMGCGFIQTYFLDAKIEYIKPLIANIFGYCFISISIPLLIDNILENQKLKKYTLSFVFLIIGFYILSTKDLLLELPAKAINPFSFMYNDSHINGLELIFKVIIAYLIYQLIISIRQNTRRK